MPMSSRMNVVPVESLIEVEQEDGTHDRDNKVREEVDQKMPNASIFTFVKEDHTLGNILRTTLHTDPDVSFAGFKPDHPTVHNFFIKLQTMPRDDGHPTPRDCLLRALSKVEDSVKSLEGRFDQRISSYAQQQ
eukprot:TRINITY_DN24840_c0_g1_i1.p1 TRINITY_DN24840_c0_g1~~TRINITY_DN24840_c0_g1_i1.p1  ORF type:complete len:133 (+),score=49.68 TRINITY_DN24840_c0_g1_i1:123-521(+)